MLSLETPISRIPKVGPRYQYLLQNLDIYTVGDLIYHFPFRYDDFSAVKKIKEIQPEETVTIQAQLQEVKNIYTRYGKKLTTAKVMDESGVINILWFNQHYLSKVLIPGKTYSFSGKVGTSSSKLTLISPDFEELRPNSLNTGRLVPVYAETAGVSSKWIRGRVNEILQELGSFPEYLPLEIINKYHLDVFDAAIRNFHFPRNVDEAERARKRFEFEEFFLELLKVEARKTQWSQKDKGIVFNSYEKEIAKFIKSLPFKLTDSQEKAVFEIIQEVATTHPMNKLLEGDVGSGKTVVAVILAYLAHLNGYKTLYMAPTEILANQHFETFNKFLKSQKIKVELKTGSKKSKNEEWDILVGTHALLFNEEFKDIGLVIVDEQHRFGVEQRAKILKMGSDNKVPHLLTMTATPIPRTLALTLYGDLSISKLTTVPNKDKKITTKVWPEGGREQAYKWIKDRGEPTFIVCPLINTSEKESMENVKAAEHEFLHLQDTVFKDMPVGLLHGKMKAKEKAEMIQKFRNGEIKILVSTPVIEVGIDIPDATVIVIESAERYGLASLHQLRGRVGRGSKEGFCYLFMSNNSRKAYERLKVMENTSSGMELAEIDLQNRGYGDLYGTMQHGFIKLKVADLSHVEIIEQAKLEAQKYFPKLQGYPLLKDRLELDTKLVGNN